MMATWAIPIATLIIVLGGFLLTALSMRSKASLDHLISVRSAIEELRLKLATCESERAEFQQKEIGWITKVSELQTEMITLKSSLAAAMAELRVYQLHERRGSS